MIHLRLRSIPGKSEDDKLIMEGFDQTFDSPVGWWEYAYVVPNPGKLQSEQW